MDDRRYERFLRHTGGYYNKRHRDRPPLPPIYI